MSSKRYVVCRKDDGMYFVEFGGDQLPRYTQNMCEAARWMHDEYASEFVKHYLPPGHRVEPLHTVNTDQLEDDNRGAKDDIGKARFDLIPTAFLREVAHVMTYGAFKAPRPDGTAGYGEYNWQRVDGAKARYYAATLRHLNAWRSGETNDKESGLHHLAHAAACIAFLVSFELGHDKAI